MLVARGQVVRQPQQPQAEAEEEEKKKKKKKEEEEEDGGRPQQLQTAQQLQTPAPPATPTAPASVLHSMMGVVGAAGLGGLGKSSVSSSAEPEAETSAVAAQALPPPAPLRASTFSTSSVADPVRERALPSQSLTSKGAEGGDERESGRSGGGVLSDGRLQCPGGRKWDNVRKRVRCRGVEGAASSNLPQ